jgi:CheY-like chemotaxis protein
MSTNPAKATSVKPPTHHVLRRTRTAHQSTILVVEDHDDTREMLHMLLEMWGYRVVEASNGLEAVAAASREKPQLILMDSRLPYLGGHDATGRIRENGNGVKIVALNGSGSPRHHTDALAAGCDESIEKPFDFDRLRTYMVFSSILPLLPEDNAKLSCACEAGVSIKPEA